MGAVSVSSILDFSHAVQCQLGAKTYQLGDFGRKKRRRLPPAAAGGIKSNPSFPVTGAAEMTLLMPEGPTMSLEIEALPACCPRKKRPAAFLCKKGGPPGEGEPLWGAGVSPPPPAPPATGAAGTGLTKRRRPRRPGRSPWRDAGRAPCPGAGGPRTPPG